MSRGRPNVYYFGKPPEKMGGQVGEFEVYHCTCLREIPYRLWIFVPLLEGVGEAGQPHYRHQYEAEAAARYLRRWGPQAPGFDLAKIRVKVPR